MPTYSSGNQILAFNEAKLYNKKSESFEIINLKRLQGPLQIKSDFSFFSVSYNYLADPEEGPVQLVYYLEGSQQGWQGLEDSFPLTFTNLPKGTYKLRLKLSDEINNGDSQEVLLDILVSESFFQSDFFISTLVMLGFFALVGFTWYRIVKISQEKETLEIKVEQRTSKIRLQKEKTEKAYNKLNSAHDQLHQAYSQLKEMQFQLIQSEKLASLGQLTAGVAHELNNPINFVYAGIAPLKNNLLEIEQLLKRYKTLPDKKNQDKELKAFLKQYEKLNIDDLISENQSLIEGIEEGARRVRDIVIGFRKFSRGEEGKTILSNIEEGLESTLSILRNEYKDRIKINKDYGNLPLVECYPGQMNQVFLNVLTNAIESIDGHGEISIKTWQSDAQVHISINDTGIGMTKEETSRIFEPFFTTKDVGKGIGLGLSISFGIIKQHHGHIEVSSEKLKGTTIDISIPVSHKEGKNVL
ncbi:MAG: ATP-binding protein [Bacteroidota bacterium]